MEKSGKPHPTCHLSARLRRQSARFPIRPPGRLQRKYLKPISLNNNIFNNSIFNTALTIIYCFNNIFNNIYAVLYIITNIFLTPVLFGNLEKIANCPVNKLKGDGR